MKNEDGIVEFGLDNWLKMHLFADAWGCITEDGNQVEQLLKEFPNATIDGDSQESIILEQELDRLLTDAQNWFSITDENNNPPFYVNVYSVDRAYGGPEEGGWYYNTAEPVRSVIVFDGDKAEDVAEKLRQEYPETGKRYSVLSGADYKVVIEPHVGESYPKEIPFYE